MGHRHHLRCEVNLRLRCDSCSEGQEPEQTIYASWAIGNDHFPELRTIRLSELSFGRALRGRAIEQAVLGTTTEKVAAKDSGFIARAKAQRVALGTQVFLALVPNEAVRASLTSAITRGTDFVRIAIRADDPALEEVPWELARDPEVGWLALHEGVSIVRLGDPSLRTKEIGILGPINIRYVDAGEVDEPKLGEERWPKHEALRSAVTTAGASNRKRVVWADVAAELAPRPNGPNVFHFTGHGDGATDAEDVKLRISGERDGSDRLSLGRLGAVLETAGIRLAILPACHAGVDVTWRALGAGLLQYVPAVVSMQGEVEDHAADAFSEEIYLRLGLGVSLDEAVSAARRRLRGSVRDPDSLLADWWLPVLHTTSSEPIRFAPHPAVQSRMGAPATAAKPSKCYEAPGRGIPVGAEGERLWSPPSGVSASDALCLTADGAVCATVRPNGELVIGRLSGERVVWQSPYLLEPGTTLLALHAIGYGTKVALVRYPEGTRELYISGGRQSPGECWTQRAESGAWTGAGFTCVDKRGEPFGSESLRPLPLPDENTRCLDVAIGANERLAAWIEDLHLVLCRTVLKGPEQEERRRVILDAEPTDVVVARSGADLPPRTAFVRIGDELRGWSWESVA
jgi:hypothetical protein